MSDSYLHKIPRIRKDLDHLIENDPVFSTLSVDPDTFRWNYIGPGYAGLVRIVIGQQISTGAADALWKRFSDYLPCVTPNAVVMLGNEEMRALGLSHQKAAYIRGLSEAVRAGTFDPESLEQLPDADVYAAITALKGLGNWSAEMFLMFGLARTDIWPAGDLGIQEGLRKYTGASARPDMEKTKKAGKIFAGRRTAAALLLWHLKARKDFPGA
jgi:DNA-3-methyladenine glycosylase II